MMKDQRGVRSAVQCMYFQGWNALTQVALSAAVIPALRRAPSLGMSDFVTLLDVHPFHGWPPTANPFVIPVAILLLMNSYIEVGIIKRLSTLAVILADVVILAIIYFP